MELTQLIQFKAIAECESMTQAAEKIHISQPTLSAMLKRLEQELNVLLFDRNKNKLILNDAGKIMLKHTNLILDVGGSFFRSQETFWKELEPETKLELCDNVIIYNQLVRNSDIVTTSTRITRHFQFDSNDRILIPVTDTELSVDYHISYLKSNKKRVNFFVEWITQCCEEIENYERNNLD